MKLWILLVGFFIISLVLNTEGFVASNSFEYLKHNLSKAHKGVLHTITTKSLPYRFEKPLSKSQIDEYNASIQSYLPSLPMINFIASSGGIGRVSE